MSIVSLTMPTDYIYGIGNEVLAVAILIIMGLIPLFHFTIRNRDWSWWILPDHRNAAPTGNRHENHEPGVTSNSQTNTQRRIPSRTYNPEYCPICLHEVQLAVETNCGHLYCGNCLRLYMQTRSILSRASCPMCRQPISVLFVCFTEQELQAAPASPASAEIRRLYQMIDEYNRRFSGEPRSFVEMIRDCPTLMRHLWNEFFSVGGLMVMFRIRIMLCFLAALVYLFSPLDIIPEAVFGALGLLDDVFVLFLLAIYISIIYRRLVVSRRMAT